MDADQKNWLISADQLSHRGHRAHRVEYLILGVLCGSNVLNAAIVVLALRLTAAGLSPNPMVRSGAAGLAGARCIMAAFIAPSKKGRYSAGSIGSGYAL
jgi:hypothetical protein